MKPPAKKKPAAKGPAMKSIEADRKIDSMAGKQALKDYKKPKAKK
jgi:hypothetical protein